MLRLMESTYFIYYTTYDSSLFSSSGQGELRLRETPTSVRTVKPIEAVDHKQILKAIGGTGREK